jgi:diguanylate cyclase (GGDEF)-like protein
MNQLPGAIKNLLEAVQQLARAARRDDKTILWNSMALEQDASVIGSDPENPDVVVFGDLNRFKQINDQHGHGAGDAALSHAGALISEHLKDCMASAYRRSGDEFVIVLKKAELDVFKENASSFQSCELPFKGQLLRFSMSFGYACTDAEDAPDFNTLLDRAEQACLHAKSLGDGKCVEWTSAMNADARVRLRSRCSTCGATISCDVAENRAPEPRLLRVCPACETPLQHPPPTQDASTSDLARSS